MHALNLSIHCGSAVATRDDLITVRTPDATATHMPISHISLVEHVEQAINETPFEIVQTAYALNKSGNHMFALMQVADVEDKDMGMVIGVRNSHNKRFAAGIVAGQAVFVCDNLSFSGEVKIARKHTKRIGDDLGDLVSGAISDAIGQKIIHAERVRRYKGITLTDAEVSALITETYKRGILNATRSNASLLEWVQPSHPEFMDDGASVWRLYNAFTESLKGASIWSVPRATEAIHELLDGVHSN